MFREKLNCALMSRKPSEEILKLVETGEIELAIPEIINMIGFEQHTHYHDKDVFGHTMAVLDAVKPKLNLRMSALLHDIGKPCCLTIDEGGTGHFYGHHIKSAEKAEIILRGLGYEGDFVFDVSKLIRYHYFKDLNIKEKGVKKLIDGVGTERLDDLFELIRADIKGKANPDDFQTVDFIERKCGEYLKADK